jgi:DNA-binding Lrp family transcriptional regulator
MSTKAYLLIEAAPGTARDVVSNLQKVKGVKSANIVSGPYDIIAVVERKSLNDVKRLVSVDVIGIPGNNRTVSCVMSPAMSPVNA